MLVLGTSVPTKILLCQRVPKKSVVLVCLTMAKLKMNQRVPNKNADLLKKISLMGTELGTCSYICQGTPTRRQRLKVLFSLRVNLPPVTNSITTQR